MKFLSTFTAVVLLMFVSPLALAGPNCDKNPTHPKCNDDGGGSGEISVQITLDDAAGDTLWSDGGVYIDGADKVTANISALQFRMTPETVARAQLRPTSGRLSIAATQQQAPATASLMHFQGSLSSVHMVQD